MNDIENDLGNQISLNKKLIQLDEVPQNPESELKNAVDADEIMLDFTAIDKDIYYSNLKKVIETQQLNIKKPQGLTEADTQIMKNLYHQRLDYIRIIRCITYSPCYQDLNKEQRWILATTRVTKEINPMLIVPSIMEADHMHSLNKNIIANDPKAAYRTYLKTILENNLSLRVREADFMIAAALKKIKIPLGQIKKILNYSYHLSPLSETERVKAIEKIIAENEVENQSEKSELEESKTFQVSQLSQLSAQANSKALYYAAVQTIVQRQSDKMKTDTDLDCSVVQILKEKKCSSNKIRQCLEYSPALQNLSIGQKKKQIDIIIGEVRKSMASDSWGR